MKAINKRATRVLDQLAAAAKDGGGAVTMDTGSPTFMAVHVELLPGDRISVAHYGEMNGDLMADPEMVFYGVHGRWYPMYYRNDYVGIERESIIMDDAGKPARYHRREQASEAVFAGQWLQNIKDQQNIPA